MAAGDDWTRERVKLARVTRDARLNVRILATRNAVLNSMRERQTMALAGVSATNCYSS